MAFIDSAKFASRCSGYDYYKNDCVLEVKEADPILYEPDTFIAKVKGSEEEPYTVELHLNHPRKSKCNCPHANGRRVMCKHIIATYFAVVPAEADRFYNEVIKYEEAEEDRRDRIDDKIFKCLRQMSKDELEVELYRLITESPEWVARDFLMSHGEEYEYE